MCKAPLELAPNAHQRIVEAWKSIPREALEASFKTGGITTTTDGSEDHLTHCIKPNGPNASGRAALEEARILDGAALVEALVLDDEDAVLLDVSDSEGGEDSDSDASIECESSSDNGPSQIRTQQATTSPRGARCTYTPECQSEICDDDF
ncbi:pogo transposable element with KRAB domain-like protein [Aphelenchoides avenae]|nr:pogo transposable element with KRAB domain-like protein [Aphelenchus avenae]